MNVSRGKLTKQIKVKLKKRSSTYVFKFYENKSILVGMGKEIRRYQMWLEGVNVLKINTFMKNSHFMPLLYLDNMG